MTTLVSIRTVHADHAPTDDERRTQWRKRAGTLPPDGSRGVVLQAVDAPVQSDAETWSGLFLGSLWTTPALEPVKAARSHRRVSAAQHLRATA
jgi:hypothetical protein